MKNKKYIRDLTLLGEEIKIARIKRKMTIKELSEIVGCSPSTLSYLENGKNNTSYLIVKKIKSVLKIKETDLVEDINFDGKN